MYALIVTWPGGGATQPALGLGRLLAARGHDVRILGPAAIEARVIAAGCSFRPYPYDLELAGRDLDAQWDYIVDTLLLGPGLPAAIRAELKAGPADVVIVDYILRSAASEVELVGRPWALLVHMAYAHHSGRPAPDPEARLGPTWYLRRINEVRASIGLEALPMGPNRATVAMAARAPLTLVAMPSEFDIWPSPPPSVLHVGPLVEESPAQRPWTGPWAEGDARPLVVVSLGSTYMRQEAVLGRIGEALSRLAVRVLLLTGFDLQPDELPAFAPSVTVQSYVPHGAVLPQAALVVTHAGMGTLMAAFAAGVPMVCLPLGRDQGVNAARAEALGVSLTLDSDASAEAIGMIVERALSSKEMRRASEGLARAIRSYGDGRLAVEAVERLAALRRRRTIDDFALKG